MGQKTRKIKVRDLAIGGGSPISVQSMCATHTEDVAATLAQIKVLETAGADIIRIAVDTPKDVEALKEVRRQAPKARLVVDLQENFRLAKDVAPYIDKIRYNPGHLHHLEKTLSIEAKVDWLCGIAKEHGLALRVGVNCGSVAPDFLSKYPGDKVRAIVESALYHCELLDKNHFENYLVSLKDSDPELVIRCNKEFAARRPEIPLHLGVTEAGLIPEGIVKTKVAFAQLIPHGIGDTVRVSLTVRREDKGLEVYWGRQILKEIAEGRIDSLETLGKGLNIISCPSCSRVENDDFVKLAEKVREVTTSIKDRKLTIAVMGCRVNGPGETDDADLGLWCGKDRVVLKRRAHQVGVFKYTDVLAALQKELDQILA